MSQFSIRPNRRHFLATSGAVSSTLVAGASSQSADAPPLAPPDKQPPDLVLPEVIKRKVGWAIVGLGQLALEEVMPAFAISQYSRPVALVSGHPDKAKRVAAAYGIESKNIFNYENYDQLANVDDVEVIYIILPNSLHAEFTLRGLKAGKHVLCEKPMASSIDECEQMISAAKAADRKLMIAYRLHYEPFNQRAIALCREKKFGKLRTITATNAQVVDPPNIRLSSDLAGGPLGDIGIYCLNATRYLTGQEPIAVEAFSYQPSDDARFREVPESVAFTLHYPEGVLANCSCCFGAAESRYYRVECVDGVIELDNAFSYQGQRLRTRTSSGTTEEKITPKNHFAAEMDHFSRCILEGQEPRTPGQEGLQDVRLMVAIEEAARSGRRVRIQK